MPLQRATVEGRAEILSLYESLVDGKARYSVWFNPRDKYFQSTGDFEASLAFLEHSLQAMELQQDSTLYYLRVHPETAKDEIITHKTPFIASIPFRLVELPETAKSMGMITGMPYGFQGMLSKLNDLPEQLQKQHEDFEARLDALENGKPTGIQGQLAGLLDNENVQTAIINAIGPVINGIINRFVPQPVPAVPRLNGTGEQPATPVQPLPQTDGVDLQLLDNTLVRLSAVMSLNDDLPKLAEYAEKNPQMFSMLLNQLRAQK